MKAYQAIQATGPGKPMVNTLTTRMAHRILMQGSSTG